MTPEFKPDRSLAELEARFSRDLELLTLPPAKDWLEPRSHSKYGPVLDMAIVGAGMAGLAAAFALKCLAVRSLKVFDRAPEGLEGPWVTTARMETLRSPPELTGPAFGFSSLTFRAWFEAQFGAAAWTALYRIPRPQWMDYLRWYRRMIDVPIENEIELIDLGSEDEIVVLTLRSARATQTVAARRVVLATGRDGVGGPYTPDMFRRLDRRIIIHSMEQIDFSKLRGKTVGVLGAGSTATDSAAEALEAGAARVAMLVRRPDVPRINKNMGIGSAGFWTGFYRLTDAQKFAIIDYIDEQAVPPPRNSMLRCTRHENFSLLADCDPRAVAVRDGRVLLDTTRGRLAFDTLILATGLAVDWSQRPELAALKPHVVLWRDRFAPAGRADYAQAEHPYLGPAFEFVARDRGASWVNRIHCFNHAANMSHGPISGDIPAISIGAERLAQGVAGALFADDYDLTWRRLSGWSNPELRGDEYTLDEDAGRFFAEQPADMKT
ncbi:MAG: NAD(P)/FAD-dependent oxidoreductase [Alphaproteobacteria bacterium]|nr:MAG: NAD(P)/FAD-dependent oxidoreductase [Alphaproteobacteria bacterium]